MWKLDALLPCLLLVSQVKGDCTALLACKNTISDSDVFKGEASLFVYATAALGATCVELSNLTNCINAELDSCTEAFIKYKLETARDIIVYMCSEGGQQTILDLADSDCIENPTAETRLDVMMQGCVQDFQDEVQNLKIDTHLAGEEFNFTHICPFVAEMGTCLVDGAADECGATMGIFVQNIWLIYAEAGFAEHGCSVQASKKRHAVKRAIPMALKHAAALKKHRK